MAKCIKVYNGGKIERVSDETAYREVQAGAAMYVPKRWWKAARGEGQD